MKKLFQHSPENPYHVSVGAVVVKDGKILVHNHVKKLMPEKLHFFLGDLDSAYTLMRESLENNESLEEAVLRGVQEEFGIEGEVVRYLGSIQADIPEFGEFEKTTLYFQIAFQSEGVRSPHDEESHTLLEWHEPGHILKLMEEQLAVTKRADLSESKIIQAYLKMNA
jgi:hypothetical protein